MKLYYLPGACPLASHIVLKWTGQSHTTQRVSREELKQDSFLALNPLGAVPVLVDDDFVLTQSAAVMEYIAEKHPDSGLLPQDPKGRANVRRWVAFCSADIHKTFALIFGAKQFTANTETQQELAASASAMLVDLFSVADRQLQKTDWIAGERSIADAYLYTVTRWARLKKLPIDDMKGLARFYDRMHADADVQAALKEEGLT